MNEQIALLETDEQMTLLESKVRSLLPRTRRRIARHGDRC